MKVAYLVLYNVGCALGWAYVLYLCLQSLQTRETNHKTHLWATIKDPLTVVQTAAFMEIVHSLIGLVSSPVVTVAMQVSSRLLLVWCYSRVYVASQNDWSLYLMTISWACVEVPRYLFYVFAQFKSVEMPYALFWLRYSLFMLLYPTGISGEVLQMYASLNSSSGMWQRITYCIFAIYLAGSPYMILNMWGNRVRSFKKREADSKPPPPLSGLVWPVTNEKTQERNSTPTNKAIWSAAVGAVSKEAQAKIEKEKNWRFGYAKHVEKSCTISLASAPDALAMAQAGLDAAQKSFRFQRDGKETSLAEAMQLYKGSFHTGEIVGKDHGAARSKDYSEFALQVPYGGKDPRKPYFSFRKNKDVLSGDQLIAQLAKWEQWGTIEPSAAASIKKVASNSKWMDLSDMYFVLLGATSAMGPLDLLLQYGANIIAVDIDRPNVWKTIIRKARNSRGRVYFPIKENKMGFKTVADFKGDDDALAANSGANLLDKTPEICNWIKTVCPGKDLTIGNYTYLDGALHVQLSVGCDAIMQGVCAARNNTSIAFLCTPTDIHVIPEEANKAAAENYKKAPILLSLVASLGTSMLKRNSLKPVSTTSGGKGKNSGSSEIFYVDGLSIAQGPNYCLAKRLQHWRAIVARSNGHKVSSNIAPSTATESVTSNATFKMAYGGFHVFRPLEVMYQETSNAVMTALLVCDLRDEKSVANPRVPITNPYQLFEYNSFHGGVWRCAYKLDTIGEVAVITYMLENYGAVMAGAVAALTSLVRWVVTGKLGL